MRNAIVVLALLAILASAGTVQAAGPDTCSFSVAGSVSGDGTWLNPWRYSATIYSFSSDGAQNSASYGFSPRNYDGAVAFNATVICGANWDIYQYIAQVYVSGWAANGQFSLNVEQPHGPYPRGY